MLQRLCLNTELLRPPRQGDQGHYVVPLRSSCLQESLIPTPQRWGTHRGAANSTRGWWERSHGNGFKAAESAGNICAQPCAHHVLQASRLFLLICQAEVSLARLWSAGSLLPSALRQDVLRGSHQSICYRNQAGIESLSTPKSSWGPGIFV